MSGFEGVENGEKTECNVLESILVDAHTKFLNFLGIEFCSDEVLGDKFYDLLRNNHIFLREVVGGNIAVDDEGNELIDSSVVFTKEMKLLKDFLKEATLNSISEPGKLDDDEELGFDEE